MPPCRRSSLASLAPPCLPPGFDCAGEAGARTALVTTRGFRDVLEIQRQLRYNINDLFVDKHPPLIPRDQILEVDER